MSIRKAFLRVVLTGVLAAVTVGAAEAQIPPGTFSLPVPMPVTQNGQNSTSAMTIANPSAEDIVQIGNMSISLGQAAMAASVPVVIASNQTAIPTSVSQVSTKLHVGSTVTTANAFQQVMAADATRHGCAIQNTSSNVEWIFYQGVAETPTLTQAFEMTPAYVWGCRSSDGSLIKDAIYITSSTAGSTYVGQAQ